jgi:hypothetical protein
LGLASIFSICFRSTGEFLAAGERMSTKRLTKDERITFTIGAAVRRALDAADPRDPDAQRARDWALLVLEGNLPPEQFAAVQEWGGWISTLDNSDIAQEILDDIPPDLRPGAARRPDPEDDTGGEVPF